MLYSELHSSHIENSSEMERAISIPFMQDKNASLHPRKLSVSTVKSLWHHYDSTIISIVPELFMINFSVLKHEAHLDAFLSYRVQRQTMGFSSPDPLAPLNAQPIKSH